MPERTVVNLAAYRSRRGPFRLQRREQLQLKHTFSTSWGRISVGQYLDLRRLPLDPAKSLKICELLQDVPYEAVYSDKLNALTKKAVSNKAAVFHWQFIRHLKEKCGFEDVPDEALDYIVDPTSKKLRQ